MENFRLPIGMVAYIKITVIAVGKLKEKYLKEGINEYVKRLSRFCDIEIQEVGDE